MGTFIDLAGMRFGRLVVLSRCEEKAKLVKWECACDCGKRTLATTKKLRDGRKRSCGCVWLEAVVAAKTKHGHSSQGKISSELRIWMNMRSRCNAATNKSYQRYGGRGIYVCKEWDNFQTFIDDMGPRPSKAHSLDRINNDGPYAAWNCRWATVAEQTRNRRTNVVINGAVLQDAADASGVKPATVRYRMRSGWPEAMWFLPPGASFRR